MEKGIDRFLNRKLGVFTHILNRLQNNPNEAVNMGRGVRDWNDVINELDVEKIAFTLNEMGAKYYFLTLMQGTHHMLSPNETFDRIAGTKPGEACIKRDLPMEMYTALSKYDIDLYLYYTGDGPYLSPAGKAFGFSEPRGHVTMDFVQKWASVLEEYSVRYGDKVKGWWIDGCYREYFGYNDELLKVYYDACKKGNPNAIVAMNNGVFDELHKNYVNEDFVCGEFNRFDVLPKSRFINGAQAHILAPLGKQVDENEWSAWGEPGIKHTKEHMLEYVKKANEIGAPVTVDMCLFADSTFDKEQLEVMKYVSDGLK